MKKRILYLSATLALILSAVTSGFSQTDLGTDCGCLPVASRTTVVNLSTLCDPATAELLADVTLTCDKMYILDEKVYVPSGKTITIKPGTVIKGLFNADPTLATALIIERGGKIYADGLKECPIVFTANADPMDGSYGIINKGQWAGIVILGNATNNLTYAKNNNIPVASGGKGGLCVSDGIGYIEGFDASNTKNNFGSATPNDDDNSGILRYVSIRYAGAILPPGTGNELNSLSLGSVGRGTTIEHIETISGADDNIELFGGTVNLKYCSVMFGWDDMLDYDLGWSGKCQFYFGIKTATNDTLNDADNGIEADADDQKSNNCPRSHPLIYNMTLIGNNKLKATVDNTGPAGIMAKEKTEGEIYNSIFCNFRFGLNLEKTQSGRLTTKSCDSTISGLTNAYDNWNADLFKVKNCTFVGNHVDFRLDRLANNAPSAADLAKFTADGNVSAASIPGFTYIWDMDHGTGNAVTTKYDAVPNPVLATTILPPADGFFKQVNYRGAFSANDNWLNDWSYAKLLHTTNGLVNCPADLNGNGSVEVTDFNVFLGAFGTTCQ